MDQPAVTRLLAANETQRVAAFERLALEHLDDAYRLARAIMGSQGDAEDAVHDAFETAWRKWTSLRDQSKFEPWFRRIVVNTCRDRLRRNVRQRTDDIPDMLPALDPFAGSEERDELDRALARLKPDDQVVLALRYYRDLKVDDIAQVVGVKPGTVMSRIHRAQARLRSILADYGGAAR